MTKFVLVGGFPWKAKDGGKGFVEEVVRGFTDPVKILFVPFAQPKEIWEEKLRKDTGFFEGFLPGRTLGVRMADERDFIEQVRWANVIYLKGGSTEKLAQSLSRVPAWIHKLGGKTLAGSSAGVEAVATNYFGLDVPGMHRGLGILPISVLVHYRSDYNAPNVDWDKAEAELKAVNENLEFVPLREGEFRVFRQ